jgi:hypothetical protein
MVVVFVDVLHQLQLGLARTDHEDLLGAAEQLDDLVEIMGILPQMAGADRTALVVEVRMTVGGMCGELLHVILRDVHDMGVDVIEPDNCVVMGHRVLSSLCGRGRGGSDWFLRSQRNHLSRG